MAFNVKSERADVVSAHILSTAADGQPAISGFWKASLSRVKTERIFRMAQRPGGNFVLEADIDAGKTHVMTPHRFPEYLEHERLKQSRR